VIAWGEVLEGTRNAAFTLYRTSSSVLHVHLNGNQSGQMGLHSLRHVIRKFGSTACIGSSPPA
jgi:hypothetical protein